MRRANDKSFKDLDKWLASIVGLILLGACSSTPSLKTILTDGCKNASGDSYKPFELFISACREPQLKAALPAAQRALVAEMKPAPRFTHYDFADNLTREIPLAAYAAQHPELDLRLDDTRWTYLDATHLFLSEGNSSKTQANTFLIDATDGAIVFIAETHWLGSGTAPQELPRILEAARAARQIFFLPDDLVVLKNGDTASAYQSVAETGTIRRAFDANNVAYTDLSKPAVAPSDLTWLDGTYYANAQGIYDRATNALVTPNPLADLPNFYPAVIWRDNRTVWYGKGGYFCTKTVGMSCVGEWVPQPLLMLSVHPQP